MTITRPIICFALLITLLGGYMLSFSAYGDDSDKEVVRLEKIFTEMLAAQAQQMNSNSAQMVMEGDVMVEKAGAYYAVTLPHISMAYTTGERFELGIIAINAIPDKDGTIKMTVALPTPMTFYGADGSALMKTTIGAQSLSGVWHEDMVSFTKLKAQYKNVLIQSLTNNTKIVIPDTQITANLEQAANGNWSGPLSFDIYNMSMSSKSDTETAKFGHISANIGVLDYSLDTAKKYEENLNALMESLDAGDAPSGSGAHLTAIYSLVTDVMINAWDGFTTNVTIDGVKINMPPHTGKDAKLVAFDKAGFSFDMKGFRKNKVSMRTAFFYEGLNIQPPPKDFDEATPTKANFDFKISNLPFRELVALGKTAVEAGTTNPQMSKMVGLQAMMSIPQLITQAGTTLSIENSYAGSNEYNVLVNGVMTANLKAMLGATGESTIEVRGLDKLLQVYKDKAAAPDISEEDKTDIAKTIKALSVMQLVGQQAKDDKGRPVRTYKFTLDEKGQALMNGTDIKAIIDQTK